MAWIVTNPLGFTNFENGTFETPATLGSDAVSVGDNVLSITSARFHDGARSLDWVKSTTPAYSPGSPTTRYQLFRLRPGIPWVAGRRYTISGWIRVNAGYMGAGAGGSSANRSIIMNFGTSATGTAYSFTGAMVILTDIKTQYQQWVNFSVQMIAPSSKTLANSWLTFQLEYPEAIYPGGVGFQNLALNIDTGLIVEESEAPPDPIVINTSKTDVTSPGGTDGSITITSVTGGVPGYTYLWSDGVTTQNRTMLPAGTYTVQVTDSTGAKQSKSITINEPSVMNATETHTNATATGVCDGTINVTPFGGVGPYSFEWSDGPSVAQNRTGLCDGNYSVTITDTTGQEVTLNVTITEPAAPEKRNSFLFIPEMNSIRFIQRVTPNGCNVFQNFFNTLFCEEEHPDFTPTKYNQKIAQCDVFPTQIQSDYESHEVELRDYVTNAVVKTFSMEMKEQLLGLQEMFGIYMTNHGAGQTRVFFNSGSIPIPLVAGDVFNIVNNGDGFNGAYSIVSIQNDLLLGAQYLVINKNYGLPDPSTSGDGIFTTNLVNFDVYEALHTFGDVPMGLYYMRIAGIGGDEPNEWESEPIELKDRHPDTNLVEYRCADNAFDMVWTTGITCRVRVESWFQQQIVKGKRTVSRNCNGSLTKVKAQKFLLGKLEIKQIPPYLYRKLSVAFDCDLIRLNNIEVQTEDDLQTPKYVTRYQLANTEIDLELVDWFKTYNSDDLGDVDADTGFIIANGGFIKRS